MDDWIIGWVCSAPIASRIRSQLFKASPCRRDDGRPIARRQSQPQEHEMATMQLHGENRQNGVG